MSLKPRRVNFDVTWQDLRETVKEVITLGNVKRDIWNDRFRQVVFEISQLIDINLCIIFLAVTSIRFVWHIQNHWQINCIRRQNNS